MAEIRMFAGNFAPRGWELAAGQLLQISQYSALFSLLGTTYGGDGRVTFGLPDLRGRVIMGTGTGPGLTPVRLGQQSGAETVSGVPAHSHALGAHSHALKATDGAGDSPSPVNNILANDGTDRIYSSGGVTDTELHSDVISSSPTGATGTSGGSNISNIQPSLGITPIICMVGYYPSRS